MEIKEIVSYRIILESILLIRWVITFVHTCPCTRPSHRYHNRPHSPFVRLVRFNLFSIFEMLSWGTNFIDGTFSNFSAKSRHFHHFNLHDENSIRSWCRIYTVCFHGKSSLTIPLGDTIPIRYLYDTLSEVFYNLLTVFAASVLLALECLYRIGYTSLGDFTLSTVHNLKWVQASWRNQVLIIRVLLPGGTISDVSTSMLMTGNFVEIFYWQFCRFS